jgi:PadR family transcriptional regulator PadR
MSKPQDGVQGTLDMLILKAISLEPVHGYGVLLRIQQLSKNRLQIQQGSLYPALYKLQHRGLITASWGESENGRKAKYYRLTAEGKRHLSAEAEHWNRLKAGIAGVMNALPEKL